MVGNRTSGTIRFVIECQERRFFIKGNDDNTEPQFINSIYDSTWYRSRKEATTDASLLTKDKSGNKFNVVVYAIDITIVKNFNTATVLMGTK